MAPYGKVTNTHKKTSHTREPRGHPFPNSNNEDDYAATAYNRVMLAYDFSIYCKLGNSRENFIFANSVKRHICHVKNSRLRHDLPTSVKDKAYSPFREGFIIAKLRTRENKPSRKSPNLQYIYHESHADPVS